MDFRITDLTLDYTGLAAVSNEVNESVCKPIAERVAQRARDTAPRVTEDYANSIHVETDLRTGREDWAHSYVVSDDWKALIIEARTGNLTKALGEG